MPKGKKSVQPQVAVSDNAEKDAPTVKEESDFEPAAQKATEARSAEPSHVETPVKTDAVVNGAPHVKEE